MSYRLLYVTTSSEEEAKAIGRMLVEERLAACVNLLGPITSFYWWEGGVQEDGEVALIAKTKAHLVDEAVLRIKNVHSYKCPCVVALPIEAGNPEFLAWIDEENC